MVIHVQMYFIQGNFTFYTMQLFPFSAIMGFKYLWHSGLSTERRAMMDNFSVVTPELEKLAAVCSGNSSIDPQDYIRYNVKRGLRDLD